jgi:hypothetical protein
MMISNRDFLLYLLSDGYRYKAEKVFR